MERIFCRNDLLFMTRSTAFFHPERMSRRRDKALVGGGDGMGRWVSLVTCRAAKVMALINSKLVASQAGIFLMGNGYGRVITSQDIHDNGCNDENRVF